MHLQAFSDADYAGDITDRKSTTGFVILFAGGPVAWCSKKQSSVVLSTTASEYVAAAHCCEELRYLRNLYKELCGRGVEITLNVANLSTVKMIKSGQTTRKSRFVDIKYHFLADELKKGLYKLNWVESNDQLADLLTKPLDNIKFVTNRNKIMCV